MTTICKGTIYKESNVYIHVRLYTTTIYLIFALVEFIDREGFVARAVRKGREVC